MLWINENCIVLGKNQNSYKEINHQFVEDNAIKVVRRLSGGGAVFHDRGNLNFTFITPNSQLDFLNFKKFLTPIVKTLETFGVKATISGRNDILIDDKKFSGNAQHLHQEWLLHHGTIMFSVTMSDVMNSLNVNPLKLKAKGINSVKSRVTNIQDHLDKSITIEDFRTALSKTIFKDFPEIEEYTLSELDKINIQNLRNEKYATWEHNFGNNPVYELNHTNYINQVGIIDIYINVKKGIITDIKIYGDFFSQQSLKFIEEILIGTKYEKSLIQAKLDTVINFDSYFHNLTSHQLTNIIVGQELIAE